MVKLEASNLVFIGGMAPQPPFQGRPAQKKRGMSQDRPGGRPLQPPGRPQHPLVVIRPVVEAAQPLDKGGVQQPQRLLGPGDRVRRQAQAGAVEKKAWLGRTPILHVEGPVDVHQPRDVFLLDGQNRPLGGHAGAAVLQKRLVGPIARHSVVQAVPVGAGLQDDRPGLSLFYIGSEGKRIAEGLQFVARQGRVVALVTGGPEIVLGARADVPSQLRVEAGAGPVFQAMPGHRRRPVVENTAGVSRPQTQVEQPVGDHERRCEQHETAPSHP